MKSKRLNTSNLKWESSILELSTNPKKPLKNILKLFEAGLESIQDLLWILPLRIQNLPTQSNFKNLEENQLFLGTAKIISINLAPVYGRRGKNKSSLFNATVVIKDSFSNQFLNLKWFNAYPNLKKQLESYDEFTFLGVVQVFNGSYQIINPKINPKLDPTHKLLIEYPTTNGVSGVHFNNIFKKIPKYLWEESIYYYPKEFEVFLNLNPLINSFKTLHGVDGKYNIEEYQDAKDRLIYDDFLKDQLKITVRKLFNKSLRSEVITPNRETLNKLIKSFPYTLTEDQSKVLEEIIQDLGSGNPMMRIIQGDVGCGKTTIAILIAHIIGSQNGQVALMCPTEALAFQHLKTFKELLGEKIAIEILVGSTKAKDKEIIYKNLLENKIQIIIGTHSLFQKAVLFSNLQLAIIDEQHKFGVEQRVKLIQKGKNTHTLLMSATPIPRTLQLAQFGDLDISTIKTIPSGRKGTQTRIVKEDTYAKYLSFIKTRVSLHEQIYIVVPAINESETLDIKNVETHVKTYKNIFPDLKIEALHGQLKSEDKQAILKKFQAGQADILISTSVIEVGINIINATAISIYNPERFGLSSLHQLRGRVGRGTKPGFCFLIPDTSLSTEGLKRLKILENSNDGFIIAEADLKNRGEGDLFGASQSGTVNSKKISSIFEHFNLFEKVQADILKIQKENPELLTPLIEEMAKDKKISTTI